MLLLVCLWESSVNFVYGLSRIFVPTLTPNEIIQPFGIKAPCLISTVEAITELQIDTLSPKNCQKEPLECLNTNFNVVPDEGTSYSHI